MMDRRAFITTIGGSMLAVAIAVEAQKPGKLWRIGFLAASGSKLTFAAFREGLRELGYVEGQNVAFELRSAEGKVEHLPDLAAELVRLKVDIILASSNQSVEAAQKATASIPIVMTGTTDPVASGFVSSLARPGGNITGLTLQTRDIQKKVLQLLKETMPSLSRVIILWDPLFVRGRLVLTELEDAAKVLGLQLQPIEVRASGDLERAFASATRSRAGAVMSTGGRVTFDLRAQIADLAIRHRLAATAPVLEYAEAGYLMTYGASLMDQYKIGARFVDRILKGAKPADLPVEQPTKFSLVINLKTAKALGLTIPPSVLGRADQIIQ